AAAGVALAREAAALLERTLGPRHEATLAAKEQWAEHFLSASQGVSAPLRASYREDAAGLLQEVLQAAYQRGWPAPSARFLLAQAVQGTSTGAGQEARTDRLLQDALVEARRPLGADHATTRAIRAALMATHAARTTTAPPAIETPGTAARGP